MIFVLQMYQDSRFPANAWRICELGMSSINMNMCSQGTWRIWQMLLLRIPSSIQRHFVLVATPALLLATVPHLHDQCMPS